MSCCSLTRRIFPFAAVLGSALLVVAVQCSSPSSSAKHALATPAALQAWDVVYGVLQHPRCMNCHPSGDAPLQGDDSRPHAQLVQRGPDGHVLFAMRCATCHQTQNLAGANLPPGAPSWHLPSADMPLVFQGRSSGDLCRQLLDPKHNGNRTPEQLLHHMAKDPLVLWGWSPGDGRAPVSTPHSVLVSAMRTWIDNDCGCPNN